MFQTILKGGELTVLRVRLTVVSVLETALRLMALAFEVFTTEHEAQLHEA